MQKNLQVTSGEIQAALEKDGAVVSWSSRRRYFHTSKMYFQPTIVHIVYYVIYVCINSSSKLQQTA